nr:conserved Plasmodium protein, unknown function [Plasmodium sp. DRC-Itaito]
MNDETPNVTKYNRTHYLFNRNNYKDSLECYSYYFDELKNDQGFIKHFGKYKNTHTIFRHHIASQKNKNKSKTTYNTNNNNNDINDMIGIYKTNELSRNQKKRKKKVTIKIKIVYNSFDSAQNNNNNNNDYNDDYNDDNNYNSNLSFSSDQSLNFLKYIKKKKTTNRLYIDENNIINMLINIGCIFMNNIKYNAAITLNHIYKINQYDLLSDRQKFYNYIQKSFYNNKHMTFPYIYSQYLYLFFFFF